MSFIDHIDELRWHIIRSLIAVLVGGIVMFINIETVFHQIILGPAHEDFLSYRLMCKLGDLIHVSGICMDKLTLEFQNTQLSGQFMMSFSVSFMLGLIVAFPYIFWEFWRFIRPALTEKERKSARGIVFWASLLFFLGVLFAYYVVAPFTINFFANYQLSPTFKNIITMSNYYGTLSDLVLGIGLVFELPVVVYFLSKVGLLTPELMRSKRNYAILIIFVLAAVITPPDWFTIWLVALPLLVLYQVSISISHRANKKRKQRQQK
ncbi:MAG: twin-arginine translocase subunit TatC [Chitinophagales bacterium]|nr:twin-arginine translocase subunit TatC [Chitinophagaceae bacterium]MCB9064073.1 twin-arginine translocase subunit TatC [Chitinophagales bacterium]